MVIRRDDLDFPELTAEELIGKYFRHLLAEGSEGMPLEETDHPPLDIYETEENMVVEVELPGVDTESLEVSVAAGLLVVEGVKEEFLEEGRGNFLCMERIFGAFRRVVPLPHPIDSSKIRAVYRMGLLCITVPKIREKRGVRRIIVVTKE